MLLAESILAARKPAPQKSQGSPRSRRLKFAHGRTRLMSSRRQYGVTKSKHRIHSRILELTETERLERSQKVMKASQAAVERARQLVHMSAQAIAHSHTLKESVLSQQSRKSSTQKT